MYILQTVFEDIDITDMKIHYDTEHQKYRCKSKCDRCGESVLCMCYDTLEDAYISQNEGIWCDKCYLKEEILDEHVTLQELVNIIDKSNDPNRLESIYDFVLGLLDEDEVREALLEVPCDCDPSDCTGEICK